MQVAKNILIFSDGTGQMGGVRPDQRLSNIYKLYRAMRPGPETQIDPAKQVAFYDPGLGVGETGGFTFRRLRNALEAAVGSGIDENVIDCYEQIIAHYETGDRILLFGFSRGAYTVRSLANVMNLCGVPTRMPDGSPVPKYGKRLRKIASDAVKYVYNHGAGKPRNQKPYYDEREKKGRRFRVKYGSSPPPDQDNVQGNVQPTFIGVFDTVAALGNVVVNCLTYAGFVALGLLLFGSFLFSWPWWIWLPMVGLLIIVLYWYIRILVSQFKYFSPDPEQPLQFRRPWDWWQNWKNGHRAIWRKKHYDRWLDSDVGFARHALAIDENRADFPRVEWASQSEVDKNKGKKPQWLRQVWFAGCHSDVGGSYPESESRLSDIALEWMIEELRECVPEVQINSHMLHLWPDPMALQHEEKYLFELWRIRIPWRRKPREADPAFQLHSSVLKRLNADAVPQVGEVKPYRPEQLRMHPQAKQYFDAEET